MKKWFLENKDGSKQEVDIIYSPILEEGGFDGKEIIRYKEPMACMRVKGVDIEKPWSIKMQPIKYLSQSKKKVELKKG